MDKLRIREEKCENFVIFHLSGKFEKNGFKELEQILSNFLNQDLPECILLEFTEISSISSDNFVKLHNIAALFNGQARELAVSSVHPDLFQPEFFHKGRLDPFQ